MIQRSENGEEAKKTHVFGFLIGLELEEGVNIDEIGNLFADAVKFHEGTGDITVDVLGEIEFVDEPGGKWEQVDTKPAN